MIEEEEDLLGCLVALLSGFILKQILWVFFRKKKVNSVFKVVKSEPVRREQGKMGSQHGMSTSVFLRSREALQHRILCFLATVLSAEPYG